MKTLFVSLLMLAMYVMPMSAHAQGDTITIVAVGDVMLGSILPNRSYLPPAGEEKKLFDAVKPYLKGDVVFCNIEGTFADQKIGAKRCNNPSQCYTFGMPCSFAQVFKDAGFNLASVANNHSGDFSTYGKNNAKRLLDSLQIYWAGFVEKPTAEFTLNGVKYGFCAFAPNSGTVSINDLANAKALVKKLKATCDIVIVSFHGGAEGRSHQHLTKQTEYCFGENRGNVYQLAHSLIDEGADIVLGHGPHVTR
nr:CapA family protein [Bacteroidales bacterium]